MTPVLTPADPPDPSWYRFTTTLDDMPFVIDVSANYRSSPADAESLAAELFQRIITEEWSLSGACADELYDTYREEWADDDPLDRDAFRRRLRALGFAIGPEGTAQITFRDGGLFRGHDVMLETTATLEPLDAFLAG